MQIWTMLLVASAHSTPVVSDTCLDEDPYRVPVAAWTSEAASVLRVRAACGGVDGLTLPVEPIATCELEVLEVLKGSSPAAPLRWRADRRALRPDMRLLANGELLIWGRVFDLPTTGRQPAISEFVLLAGHRPIPDDQLAAIATAADFPVPRWNGPPTYLRRVDWQGRSFPSTSGGRALGLLTHGTIGVPCAVTLARRASTAAIEGAMARELPVGDVVQAAADAEGGGWLNAVLQWEELTNRARP